MTNKHNLILDASSPEQFVQYKTQSVAFYDGFKAKVVISDSGKNETIKEPVVYICIRSANDTFSVVKRRAKDRFVSGQSISETVLYKRAYDKYLSLKNAKLSESAELLSSNLELENKVKELQEEVKKTKSKKSNAKKVELKKSDSIVEDTKGVAEPVLTLQE